MALKLCICHLRVLLRHRFLTPPPPHPQGSGDWKFAFLTSSWVMLRLWVCSGRPCVSVGWGAGCYTETTVLNNRILKITDWIFGSWAAFLMHIKIRIELPRQTSSRNLRNDSMCPWVSLMKWYAHWIGSWTLGVEDPVLGCLGEALLSLSLSFLILYKGSKLRPFPFKSQTERWIWSATRVVNGGGDSH